MQALLIVDYQNDFLSQGALAVPGADKIAPLINQLMPHFTYVIASQDWHPEGHVSFASSHPESERSKIQRWPDHCVQGTWGAALSDALDQRKIDKIIQKGTLKERDSYSAFFNDEAKRLSSGLKEFLNQNKVLTLLLVGVALEYCVAATAIDGVALGYDVGVLEEGIASLAPLGECQKIFKHLQKKGVKIMQSKDLFN